MSSLEPHQVLVENYVPCNTINKCDKVKPAYNCIQTKISEGYHFHSVHKLNQNNPLNTIVFKTNVNIITSLWTLSFQTAFMCAI